MAAIAFKNWTNVTDDGRNDLVFENRNKEYGAYLIRKRYNRTLILIYTVCCLVFVLGMTVPKIIDMISAKLAQEIKPPDVTIDLPPPPPLDPTIPPPPPPPPPPVQATVQFVPPKVTDEDVPDEQTPPPLDDKTQISTTTQEGTGDIVVPEEQVVVAPANEEPFIVVEEMPQFPGGEAELMKWIQKNIQYPQIEKENQISGTVYVGFVIDKEGNVTDVQVLRGVKQGPGLEKEALRVSKMMPKWKAGKNGGRAVPVRYNLPIKFVLR